MKRIFAIGLRCMILAMLLSACTQITAENQLNNTAITAVTAEKPALSYGEEQELAGKVSAATDAKSDVSLTEEQKMVEEAGFFVEWLDPEIDFDSVVV